MGFGAAALTFIAGSGLTGAAAVASAALRFALFTAGSTLLAKKFAPSGPGIASRTVTHKGTIEPQAIVYGEALVAASTLAYRKALGNNNSQLWTVHCLAGHEVDSITDIYLDDKQIANSLINGGAAGGGGVTSGTFGPTRGTVNTVEVWKHLGTSSQTYDTNLASADTDGEWTSTHRLRGIAYIVTMFKLNDKTEATWEAGDPTNVKALIRGKKIYDPRLDSTRLIDSTTSPQTYGSGSHRVDTPSTWEWSDNPALCVADYLMDAKFSPLEGGIDPARIDWEAVAKAADDCDTLVFVPPAASPQNTEKRFTCNGVLYGTASGQQNLEALLSSMNGSLVFSGGQYVIRAGVYESPADTLSEDDIIGPIGIKTSLTSDERVNSMKAVFIDPNKKYEPTETVLISPSAYKTTRDGGAELVQSIDLPMTDSWYMAQRIVIKRLAEANQEVTLTVPCNLRAARLVPGERVNLTITERSWAPKVFKVIDWDFYDRGGDQIGVKVTLREDDSSAYADPDVADYNTITNGTLTIADPTPIPSVDTIPRGIHYFEGSWSIALTVNEDALGANDGEIAISQGRFVLPTGSVRRTRSLTAVYTPYEGSTVPPDGRFYIVWGATNPVTRFAASPEYNFGESEAESAGIFCAIYDRFNDQWYAVDNGGNEIEFTPAATDYVVATGTKTSASGGIDSLTSIVASLEGELPANMLPARYSAFEPPLIRSDFIRDGGGRITDSLTTSEKYIGSRCLQLVIPQTGAAVYTWIDFSRYYAPSSGGGTIASEHAYLRFPTGGRKFLICAQLKAADADSLNTDIRPTISTNDTDIADLGPYEGDGYQTISQAGEWEQHRWIFDSRNAAGGETETFGILSWRLDNNNVSSPQTEATIYMDAVMVFDITDQEIPGWGTTTEYE